MNIEFYKRKPNCFSKNFINLYLNSNLEERLLSHLFPKPHYCSYFSILFYWVQNGITLWLLFAFFWLLMKMHTFFYTYSHVFTLWNGWLYFAHFKITFCVRILEPFCPQNKYGFYWFSHLHSPITLKNFQRIQDLKKENIVNIINPHL